MAKRKKYYYYSDDRLQLEEVKWIRLKVTGLVGTMVMVCIVALLGGAYVFRDKLGFGVNQLTNLQHENKMLNEQIAHMNSQVTKLESTISELGDQGNHLRLLVDLPAIDEGTKQAGTGGAVTSVATLNSGNNIADIIHSASNAIEKLSNEVKVQKQNYEEIEHKEQYNKGYFAAMPALKPMDGYYSTNGFGRRMHPVLGIFKNHQGLDIINDVGTPVYASGDGVAQFAGQSGGGYGTMVMLNHGYGYETLYAHLSKVLVHEGQRVKRGDLIARSGRTGLVSGPHLHYEVRYRGVIQNPVNYFMDDIQPQQYKAEVARK